MTDLQELEGLLDRLWQDFQQLNPQARRVHDLFVARGDRVVNDHVALRTFALPGIDQSALIRPFLAGGYEPRGAYVFPSKMLRAQHYELPSHPEMPKIFVSELLVDQLPRAASALIDSLLSSVPASALSHPELCTVGRPWEISYSDYCSLRDVSEYAAWFAAFGFRANHFTVSVNHLSSMRSIEQVNALLHKAGFALLEEGGEVKGTPGQLLEQSSLLASVVSVRFREGERRIPGCYYEFARRYPGPSGALFQGFIDASADRIFESTDRGQ